MRIVYVMGALLLMLAAVGCSKSSYKILQTTDTAGTKLVQVEVQAGLSDDQIKAMGKEISEGKDTTSIMFYEAPAANGKLRGMYAAGMLLGGPMQLPTSIQSPTK